MSFEVFTMLGIAAGIAHLMIVRPSFLGPASSISLAVVGAWLGALLVNGARGGHWAVFGTASLAGSGLGAVLTLAAMEVAAAAYWARERA